MFQNDFKKIFVENIPLIDVRAPIEFYDSHFPNSYNLPLLTNEEREKVGVCYKKSGQAKAIELGHELVCGPIKEERIGAWLSFIKKYPHAQLYCYRGGLRSKIACEWIKEKNVLIPRIEGGHKALRHFLLKSFSEEIEQKNIFVLSGRTGSKKTVFLRHFSPVPYLDLELRANHRGSSFGEISEQPRQSTFENFLAVDLLKLESFNNVLVEDESRNIGKLVVPELLFNKMKVSKYIVLEIEFNERVEHILQEYVIDQLAYKNKAQVMEFHLNSLLRIEKRLGGKSYQMIKSLIIGAFSNDHFDSHREWIKELLILYYDPMYDYHIKKIAPQIIFKGNILQCQDFLKQY